MADILAEATKVLKNLSTKPGIRGSEAYRGLKKVVAANKSLGKSISADVRKTITDGIANLTAMAAVREHSNVEQSKAASSARTTATSQLEDIMKIMYNQGENGIGQDQSTTINKGPTDSSKGD